MTTDQVETGIPMQLCILRNAKLIGADLSGLNLIGANLIGANLRGTNLRSADLSGADLIGANLRDANLRDANLSRADLEYSDLGGANLTGADLRHSKLEGSNLENINLQETIGDAKYVISIQLLEYSVTYTHDRLQIGCQNHSILEWWSFSDEMVESLDVGALDWWEVYKPLLMGLIAANPAIKN